MTAKDKLMIAARAQDHIRSLKEELKAVKGEEQTEKLIEEEIYVLREEYAKTRAIIDSIKKDQLRMILRYRYLNGMDWRHVGKAMNLCDTSLFRLHKEALKAFDEQEKKKQAEKRT